jgi:gas vesicle protein
VDAAHRRRIGIVQRDALRAQHASHSGKSRQEVTTMSEDRSGGFALLGAFVLGGLIGAGIALLSAPRSGKETRDNLGRWAQDTYARTGEKIGAMAHDAGEKARAAVQNVKDRIAHRGETGESASS